MKLLIKIIAIVAINFILFSQNNPELVIQLSHTSAIQDICISNNSKLIASGGYDGSIRIWDRSTLKLIRILNGHKAKITSIEFSPDSKLLVSGSWDHYVKVWEIESGKCIHDFGNQRYFNVSKGEHINILEHKSRIMHVCFSNDGKYVVSSSKDQTTKVWELAVGKPVLTVSNEEEAVVKKSFLSSDNKWLLTLANQKVTVFEFATGKKVASTESVAKDLFFSKPLNLPIITSQNALFEFDFAERKFKELISIPGSQWAIYADPLNAEVLLLEENSKKTFLINSDKKLLQENHVFRTGNMLSPDRSFYFGSVGYAIELYDSKTDKLIGKLFGKGHGILSLKAGYSGTQLYMAYNDSSVSVFDLKHCALAQTIGGTCNSEFENDFSISTSEEILFTSNTDGKSTVYQKVPTGNFEFKEKLEGTLVPNSAFNRFLFKNSYNLKLVDVNGSVIKEITSESIEKSGFNNSGSILYISMKEKISLYNSENGKKICDLDVSPLSKEGIINHGNFALSSDGKLIAGSFGSFNKSYALWNAENGSFIKWLKIRDIELISGNNKVESNNAIAISPDNNFLIAEDDYRVHLFDLKAGTSTILEGHHDWISSLDFHPSGKYFFSGSMDGKVIVWDVYAKKLKLSIITLKNGKDFLVTTPAYYYYATKGAHNAVDFRIGLQMYSFDQFDLKYNRPDIILKELSDLAVQDPTEMEKHKALIESSRKAYEKRLKKMNFTEEMLGSEFHFPETKLLNRDSIQLVTQNSNVQLTIEAKDSKHLLDRILIRVNNVPIVVSENGLDLRALKKGKIVRRQSVPLSIGTNKISISALNEKGVESLKEVISIAYQPNTQPSKNLYLVVMGSSNYSDNRFNLRYASKDARDIANALSKNKRFDHVYVDSLFDHAMSKEAVVNLKAKLSKTTVNDYVILFYAGHGILDAQLNYYLATHRINFSKPEEGGLPYEKLEELLAFIPARNKLLLVDACHSGEIDKDEMVSSTAQTTESTEGLTFRSVNSTSVRSIGKDNSFELMKQLFSDLRNGSGATVISSAGGGEYAMEGDEWKNGIFTYCLLKSIQSKDADLNKDSSISVSELKEYLQNEVFRITSGKQKPTSRNENIENDWIIAE